MGKVQVVGMIGVEERYRKLPLALAGGQSE
jgi:hypothetical protein